jgi:hypothetical protein
LLLPVGPPEGGPFLSTVIRLPIGVVGAEGFNNSGRTTVMGNQERGLGRGAAWLDSTNTSRCTKNRPFLREITALQQIMEAG